MLKTQDQYKEAATVYFRICAEVVPIFPRKMKVSLECCFLLLIIFFLRIFCILLWCLNKHPTATCCPNLLCYVSMGFILCFLVITTKSVIRYLSAYDSSTILHLLKCVGFSEYFSCLVMFRSNMPFEHIEVLFLFLGELLGVISKIMFISI